MTRPRTRTSAKAAGTRHESAVAAFLAATVDERIERRTRNGAKDRGDISGLRTPHGGRIVIEAKNCARLDVAAWLREAELERGNDDAIAAAVVAKRHGKGDPADQVVLMTLADFAAILTGSRPLSVSGEAVGT